MMMNFKTLGGLFVDKSKQEKKGNPRKFAHLLTLIEKSKVRVSSLGVMRVGVDPNSRVMILRTRV